MQDEKYSIDGEWPEFESLGALFDWLSDERYLKAAPSSLNDNLETSRVSAESQHEALSAV
jgi:hypothetical protein